MPLVTESPRDWSFFDNEDPGEIPKASP